MPGGWTAPLESGAYHRRGMTLAVVVGRVPVGSTRLFPPCARRILDGWKLAKRLVDTGGGGVGMARPRQGVTVCLMGEETGIDGMGGVPSGNMASVACVAGVSTAPNRRCPRVEPGMAGKGLNGLKPPRGVPGCEVLRDDAGEVRLEPIDCCMADAAISWMEGLLDVCSAQLGVDICGGVACATTCRTLGWPLIPSVKAAVANTPSSSCSSGWNVAGGSPKMWASAMATNCSLGSPGGGLLVPKGRAGGPSAKFHGVACCA
mmetsp:Transcript_55358/g.120653  ORF Transcript_55358/g.120653 Transcript_55358/m.120653 type:complete len:261 (-) Transcript_55358:635-1417(-)